MSESPSATRSTCTFFSSLCLTSSTLNSHPSPPPQPPVQDTCECITILPAFTAPHLSFLCLLFLFSFLYPPSGCLACGTAVHFVPCLTISLSLITPLSWTIPPISQPLS